MGSHQERRNPEGRRWLIFFGAALLAAACSSKPTSAFDAARAQAHSTDPRERRLGAARMVTDCCFSEYLDPSNRHHTKERIPEACREVGILLAAEQDRDVLDRLISVSHARCFEQFPAGVVAKLCRGSCTPALRTSFIDMLSQSAPTPEAVTTIIAALEDRDPNVRLSAAVAIGHLGEADLWPVIDAFASPHAMVRLGAARGFLNAALHAPLDLPAAQVALEQLKADPDPEVAQAASLALKANVGWNGISAREAVAGVMRPEHRVYAARLLAVRKFSCQTTDAKTALETLVAEGTGEAAAQAQHAIRVREQRCPRLP